MTTAGSAAAAGEEEYEAPVDFGDPAVLSRGMTTSATTSVASSSRVIRTPSSAPAFSAVNKKTTAGNISVKSDQRASKNQSGEPSSVELKLPENSFHSSPQPMQNNINTTPQRIHSSRRDLEQKLRYRSNRHRNNATFQHRSSKIQINALSNTNDVVDGQHNNSSNNNESAPLPKALTELLLQTAILGIDTTAKLSKPTLALTKNTLLPQIILPLLTELWETYAPDRLQTWMKVLPSSLKNLHDLLWETYAGQQFGQKSFQLGEDIVDMVSSEVARQYCIDVTVTLIKLMDALHTPEVRKLLDQFAISMCRLVDVMSSGKAKQVWFDVSDTIWAALEVGSDEVMVMALAEGCAKVCFALERERESLKRRKRNVRDGSDDEVGKSGKVKTERLIAASRRRKERDQRQMETYPPGKDVLREGSGRDDIEDVLMDGLASFTKDYDQQREDNDAIDDADQIYMNMSSIVHNNDRPPQKVIVPANSMEDFSQPFPDAHAVVDRDDESEITTEIEDLRGSDGNVDDCNNLRPQMSANMHTTDTPQQQGGALVYESEQVNTLDNAEHVDDDAVSDEKDGISERYDNFDEPVLQFYRRLNDVLTQTRKGFKMREALEPKQNDASSRRAGNTNNVRNDDTATESRYKENDTEEPARSDGSGLFSISKKWWKLLLVALIFGTLTMCLLWALLGCYGFYVIFIAKTPVSMTAAQAVQRPIVIQIASKSSQDACILDTEQSDPRNVAISLEDWKGLAHDVNAAIDNLAQSE
mmetsp:Transcript_18379/g.30121  ORF Transcript_18379/g.30121 Transcript_18379/m.30121 type:complete len:759 (+) Transcript_18379:123-2399(+)